MAIGDPPLPLQRNIQHCQESVIDGLQNTVDGLDMALAGGPYAGFGKSDGFHDHIPHIYDKGCEGLYRYIWSRFRRQMTKNVRFFPLADKRSILIGYVRHSNVKPARSPWPTACRP